MNKNGSATVQNHVIYLAMLARIWNQRRNLTGLSRPQPHTRIDWQNVRFSDEFVRFFCLFVVDCWQVDGVSANETNAFLIRLLSRYEYWHSAKCFQHRLEVVLAIGFRRCRYCHSSHYQSYYCWCRFHSMIRMHVKWNERRLWYAVEWNKIATDVTVGSQWVWYFVYSVVLYTARTITIYDEQ